MKRYIPLVFLMMLTFTVKAQLITIGTATTTENYVPCYGYYDYGWSAMLYLQSEIGLDGDITSIAFYVDNAPSSYTMVDQRIYMRHVAANQFPNGDQPNAGSMTLVYQGDITWNGSGWHTITLDTPFPYNNIDNLGIYYENRDGSYASGYPVFRYTSQTNRAIYRYLDGSFPASAGTLSSYLPNIQLNITPSTPMSYASSTVTQNNTTPVTPGSTNQEVVGIQVVTSGGLSPLSATSFSCTTIGGDGTTAPATDIQNAKLWYTGTSSTFATTTQFGSTVAAPNGVFSFAGSQTLSPGTNYFWLTYDIQAGATDDNWVDARCTSLNVSGAQTPSTTNPAGGRQIKRIFNMSNGSATTCSGMFYDSGGNSGSYQNNEDYEFTFTPSTAGAMMSVEFTAFNTESGYDYLYIHDGGSSSDPLLMTLNGSSVTVPFTVTATNASGELTFVFHSDGSSTYAGWEASVSCLSPYLMDDGMPTVNTCSGVFTDDGGVSGNYSDNNDTWVKTFCSDNGESILFDFTEFETRETADYLTIYDGPNTGSPVIGTYSETTSPGIVISSGTCMTFGFTTDGNGQDPGWISTIQCVPTPPANNQCTGAIALTVNPDQSCATVTSATTYDAWDSGIPACTGSGADDDVWFSFVATSTSHDFTIDNISGTSVDMVHEIFSGTCGSLASIACSNPDYSLWGGFTIGQTYYVRVYTYGTGVNADFDICVGTPPPPPSNDDPCGATPLFVNSGSCTFQSAMLDASSTITPGVPAPGCGWLHEDIWFTAVVPASGQLIIDTEHSGGPDDIDMAWYTAPSCSGPFTLIECDDADSQDGAMSMICRTGASCTVPGDCQQNATLTPGETIYVRVWDYDGTFGPFVICAYEPASPGPPSNCGAPTNIASLPFAESNTTCCRQDDYDSGDGCGSTYQDGEDFMYTYTPSVDETIDITLTGTLTYTGVFVTDDCPDHGGVNCIASSTSSSGNPMLCGVMLDAGTTYYIMVSTLPGPTCTPFNIRITESTAPSCGLNYTVSNIGYAPDLNAGTTITLPIDDRFSNSYIPIGFPFCFDGFQFTQLLVSSNGYVIFDPIGCATNLPSTNAAPDTWSGYSINLDVPNTSEAPRNCIMFPWQDIDPAVDGTIKYQTLGTSPNQRFVLTFSEVRYFSSSCHSLLFTGQLKLFETSNNIEIHIDNKEVCPTWNDAAGILGLHNYNGTISVIPGGHNYSTPWTANNEAWRFTCNCVGCVALPVELVEFTGEKISTTVNYLKWTTATELNNDYFEVERRDEFSEDFVTLERIDGVGNSNSLQHYSYTDIDAPSGAAYYRLKQVDTDGKYQYSPTIAIGASQEIADINTVYPNPAQDRLNIKLNSDGGDIKIALITMGGQEIVLEESISLYGFNEVSYDVSDVPAGIYYLRISSLKNEVFYKEKIVIE